MPWAPCRIVVIATVASKPQIIMLQNDGRPVTDIGSPVWLSRRQCEGRVDQAHMGERLGKVAEGSSSLGINLLREQSDVVGECKNAVERPLRAFAVAAPCQVIDRPEAADPESAFPRLQAVTAGLVSVEETVASEPLVNEVERPAHARIVRFLVSKASHEQQRRVDPVSIELAHVAAKAFIEASHLDHRADLVALLPEALRVDADKPA